MQACLRVQYDVGPDKSEKMDDRSISELAPNRTALPTASASVYCGPTAPTCLGPFHFHHFPVKADDSVYLQL